MKLAVISVTNRGALLGREVADKLIPLDFTVQCFAKNGRNPTNATTYELLSTLIRDIFSAYDGLLFIMATGIVVRVIAPYIQDKRVDPAVIVMDEGGHYVISLLAGHIGGGNELATCIGQVIHAQPVITTATDVCNKPAADVLAVKLYKEIYPFSQLKSINGAIVNGDVVRFFIDTTLPNQDFYRHTAQSLGIVLQDITEISTVSYDAAVLITDQSLAMDKAHLYLRSAPLAVGIGCRRGTTPEEIFAAITDACFQIGYTIRGISRIGSTILKQDEVGLLAVIKELGVPSQFFTNEELQECIDKQGLEVSNFVKKQIGVGNVCAAAAILMGQTNKLLLPKTKYKKVTVAITLAKSPL
jgi:cobalt-precorrin 5A hydrolase